MTDISFHFNAADKAGHACRLAYKAVGRGSRLVITGPEPLLAEIDAALWVADELAFFPHAGPHAPPGVHRRSPVRLLPALPAQDELDVVVNLGQSVPEGFHRARRLIEVVASDTADRDAARVRWRHYRGAGYTLEQHDLAERRATGGAP